MFYVFFALRSITTTISGASDVSRSRFASGVPTIAAGVLQAVPLLVVYTIGRQRLFDSMAKRFAKAHAVNDGAFIAQLLDTAVASEGDTWWIHRDEPNERFGHFDPRRNWQKGVVKKTNRDNFLVVVPPEQDPQDGQNVFLSPSMKSLLTNVEKEDGSLSAKSRFKSISRSRVSPLAPIEYTIPITNRGLSADELMRNAVAELRCIDWANITRELLSSSTGGGSGVAAVDLFTLSRPVAPGEQIDYFMSHSWHDDAETKFDKLTAVAEIFRAKKGRDPTFWLDKVCIHQSRIGDGLKSLPVNVMACSQMLVLCGSTYPNRLWCVWELFTLLSFSTLEHAQERITLAALTSDGSKKDGLGDLMSFDVANAHCYDPNEEARLRSIIRVSTEFTFNSRIRKLAEACRTAQKRWGYLDLGMGLIDIKSMLPLNRKTQTEFALQALRERVSALEASQVNDQGGMLVMEEVAGTDTNESNRKVGAGGDRTAAASSSSIDEKCATLKRLRAAGQITEDGYREAERRVLMSAGL